MMEQKKHKIELLAPAGNLEAFMGAISAGADAIYLGGAKFGARAYADNFTTEELVYCIRYAHIFGRKVYLTVNTLMKEEELKELKSYLLPFYEAGLDAVIIQDIGVFEYIRKNFPGLELHVSTQMTITGANGARMLKEMGASRIVPARELSLKEIVHMKEATGLEIETFIHGAMCYCYSGQCLFSSILGGRSGNRGRCAQPCRLPYIINTNDKGKSECYPLSLKDMCTIEHIGKFIDAGIDSFKIEGRMKKAEYAAGVTAIYRKYIDQKLTFPQKEIKVERSDMDILAKLYIRSERQDGYYYKHNGADMVTLQSPAYSGSDDDLLQSIRNKYIENPLKIPISIYASFFCDCEVSVTLVCGENSVTVTGDIMEVAQKAPITEETIEKQLKKLGDTCFEAEYIEISTDGQGFYSLKLLNELRRAAVRKLEEALIESHGLIHTRRFDETSDVLSIGRSDSRKEQGDEWSILVSSKNQLDKIIDVLKEDVLPVKRLYVESELFLSGYETSNSANLEIFIALPYVMRRKDEEKIHTLIRISNSNKQIKGMLFRNLEEYRFLINQNYEGKLIADAGIYVWNTKTVEFWENKVDLLTCPVELNKREWQNILSNVKTEKIVYGRLPMMITANCIAKTGGKCVHGDGSSVQYITDRYKKKFPSIIQCNYCMNIILNSVPLSLHSKECQSWYNKVSKRISFTVENAEEVGRVLNFFAAVRNGYFIEPPFSEYTTGHEKRGVE